MSEKKEKKILFLLNDSDPLLSRVLKAKFQKGEGWLSEITHSVKDAKNLFNKIKPDIILSELLISGDEGDGFDLVSYISEKSKIPIVVFSELSQDSDKDKAKKLGATHYYVKSQVSVKDLIEKLKNII